MDFKAPEYVSLDHPAGSLGLPKSYLRELAIAGRIPCLNIRGRWRFEEAQVRAALREIADRAAEHQTHLQEVSV